MTVGPRFLERILRECRLPSLRHVNVGGAPMDCVSLEEGIRRFPHARINWLYGSSEAEPICVTGAREAAAASRARGLVQVLWLGRPVPEIRLSLSAEELWVCGPHVSGVYLASPEANARFKRMDPCGATWHNTGDRVIADPPWAARPDGSPAGASAPASPPAPEADGGLWYAGRASQPLDDFWIEQKLYAALGHSRAFVMRYRDGSLRAYGMGIAERTAAVRSALPEIDSCSDIRAVRYDPRHRSRIRREESLGQRRG
jgi:acyl-CoA synthetase (AMP-forming)/AMP-acid ligase II